MKRISITQDKNGWTVRQGDRYADCLCYDEMLALLVTLTYKESPSTAMVHAGWMKTKEEWAKYEANFKKTTEEYLKSINDNGREDKEV